MEDDQSLQLEWHRVRCWAVDAQCCTPYSAEGRKKLSRLTLPCLINQSMLYAVLYALYAPRRLVVPVVPEACSLYTPRPPLAGRLRLHPQTESGGKPRKVGQK